MTTFADAESLETALAEMGRRRLGKARRCPHRLRDVQRALRPRRDPFRDSSSGRVRRLRGMYARVVEAGTVRPGDEIRTL